MLITLYSYCSLNIQFLGPGFSSQIPKLVDDSTPVPIYKYSGVSGTASPIRFSSIWKLYSSPTHYIHSSLPSSILQRPHHKSNKRRYHSDFTNWAARGSIYLLREIIITTMPRPMLPTPVSSTDIQPKPPPSLSQADLSFSLPPPAINGFSAPPARRSQSSSTGKKQLRMAPSSTSRTGSGYKPISPRSPPNVLPQAPREIINSDSTPAQNNNITSVPKQRSSAASAAVAISIQKRKEREYDEYEEQEMLGNKLAKTSKGITLPPPPGRSRKIIQMNPRINSQPQPEVLSSGDYMEDPDFIPSVESTATTKAKAGRKGKNAQGSSTSTIDTSTRQTATTTRKTARKTAHSLIERRRRFKMNEEFNVLKNMIPACKGQEMHKLAILQACNWLQNEYGTRPGTNGVHIQASIEYVKYLEQCIDDLKADADARGSDGGYFFTQQQRQRKISSSLSSVASNSPSMLPSSGESQNRMSGSRDACEDVYAEDRPDEEMDKEDERVAREDEMEEDEDEDENMDQDHDDHDDAGFKIVQHRYGDHISVPSDATTTSSYSRSYSISSVPPAPFTDRSPYPSPLWNPINHSHPSTPNAFTNNSTTQINMPPMMLTPPIIPPIRTANIPEGDSIDQEATQALLLLADVDAQQRSGSRSRRDTIGSTYSNSSVTNINDAGEAGSRRISLPPLMSPHLFPQNQHMQHPSSYQQQQHIPLPPQAYQHPETGTGNGNGNANGNGNGRAMRVSDLLD